MAFILVVFFSIRAVVRKGGTQLEDEIPSQTETTSPTVETEPPLPPETKPVVVQKVIDPPTLTAEKAFIYDCGLEQYVYVLGDPSDSVFPASTTKLFTCYVAIQYLSPNTVLTVGNELDLLEYLASTAGLQVGDKLTVQELIKCVLLPSGCDAAYTLAAAAGRIIAGNDTLTASEAVNAFVEEMNRMGEELGFENTHFVTCDGYHRENHYISLSAYVKIGKLCLSEPAIASVTSLTEADVDCNGRTLHLVNLNEVMAPGNQYYREDCVGLKTGRTNSAGSCMLAAFWKDERYVLIGVFKSEGYDGRYQDVDALYDAYFGS